MEARCAACVTIAAPLAAAPAPRRDPEEATGRGSQMSLRSRHRRHSSNSMGLRSRLLSRQRSACASSCSPSSSAAAALLLRCASSRHSGRRVMAVRSLRSPFFSPLSPRRVQALTSSRDRGGGRHLRRFQRQERASAPPRSSEERAAGGAAGCCARWGGRAGSHAARKRSGRRVEPRAGGTNAPDAVAAVRRVSAAPALQVGGRGRGRRKRRRHCQVRRVRRRQLRCAGGPERGRGPRAESQPGVRCRGASRRVRQQRVPQVAVPQDGGGGQLRRPLRWLRSHFGARAYYGRVAGQAADGEAPDAAGPEAGR